MGTATLNLEGKTYELPIVEGSEGEKAIDVRNLRNATGYVTLDDGFFNTAACSSEITFLDGEKGILRYRGYPIEELASKSNFLEIAYLLIYGEFPSGEEYQKFVDRIKFYTDIPPGIKNMIDTFPKGAHPMAILGSMVSALSAFYPEFAKSDLTEAEQDEVIALLMAQVRILSSFIYRNSKDLILLETCRRNCFCSDFLGMTFGRKSEDPAVLKALDLLLILHADHEQNCSTSTVRLVASSKANAFAAISSGIHALWGPLHGGANQAVIEMLQQIHQDGGDCAKFLARAKDKNDPFRLMGFGHRVYKNFDPRAALIKKACDYVLEGLGKIDPVLDVARRLEKLALADPYFIEKKLYPNVDFYSGIIYKALDIPEEMFTVMFALGRIAGWLSQWKEFVNGPMRIGRPRQIYMGQKERHVDMQVGRHTSCH